MKDTLATEAPPKVTFTEFNVRQESGTPHFIRLQDSVVKRLEKQLLENAPGAATRFGLLLGSIEAGEQSTIAVDDFEPVEKLDDRLRTWMPQPGSQHRIVGYYRTHSRTNFGLDPGDFTLFERHFPKESRLVLLIKPPSRQPGAAMFFLGENGRLVFDRATVEFPFNLVELGAEEAPAGAAPTPKIVSNQIGSNMAASAQPPAQPVKPAPRSSGLFWKVVQLSAAGVVVIASLFGLNELRVFDHPAAAPPPAPAAAASPRSVAEPAPAPEPEPVAETKPAQPKPQPPKPAAVVPPAKPAPVKPAVVAQNTISKAPVTPPPAPVSVPPTAAPAVSRPAATLPPPSAPPVAEERPRVVPPAFTPPPAPAPALNPVEAIPVTPPRVIRQFAPVLPENVRRRISGEVVVRVKVNVDASGKVTSAEPINTGSVSDALVSTAVGAVKRWEFDPAQRAGEKVPGDIVLSFIFRK